MAIFFRALALLALLMTTSLHAAPPWQNWQTKQFAGHPLVGTIWSAAKDAAVTPGDLATALAAGHYVLLGEIHDNPDHHALQGWAITQLAARGRRPAIVLEMVQSDKAEALAAYQDRGGDAAGLGKALNWGKSGWPAWAMYRPIAEAAFAAGLRLYSGDAPRPEIRTIGKKGLGSLAAARRTELRLDAPLPGELDTALRLEIVESHCNMLPASATGPMVGVQRFRDARLADSMIRVDSGDGAVLIGGGGHVRKDRAVPWYLHRRAPGRSVVVLSIVEADPDKETIAEYLPLDPGGQAAADFIWITPRAKREDPCASLERMMKKRKEKQGQ
jgi:uncharacterized iron-regulated protein